VAKTTTKAPTGKANFAAALKKLQGTWKKAKKRVATEERSTGFAEFPDGRYIAKLVHVGMGVSEAGRTQAIFQWKFIDGDYEGQTKFDYQGMDSEDNLFYLGRRLEDFEYELPDDIAEIEAIFKELTKLKPVAKIRMRTKAGSDFQNVYVDKVFGEDEEPELEEADEDEDAEEEEETDEAEESDEEESDEEESDEEEAEEESDEDSDDEDADEDADEEEAEEEEEEDDEDVDEEADLQVGMDVIAEFKGEKKAGKVVEILEQEGKARIRFKDGKTVRVAFDKLELDDTPPEEPKAKAKKTKAAAEPPPKAKAGAKKATKKK
jgi:hypothetical protein